MLLFKVTKHKNTEFTFHNQKGEIYTLFFDKVDLSTEFNIHLFDAVSVFPEKTITLFEIRLESHRSKKIHSDEFVLLSTIGSIINNFFSKEKILFIQPYRYDSKEETLLRLYKIWIFKYIKHINSNIKFNFFEMKLIQNNEISNYLIFLNKEYLNFTEKQIIKTQNNLEYYHNEPKISITEISK